MLALSLLGWGTRAGSTPSPGPEKESWVVVKETHQVLDKLFPKFLKGLQDAGWKTEKHQLEVDEWRATWLPSPEKKVL